MSLFFREMKWNIYLTHVITTLPRGFHVKTFQIQPSRHTKSSIFWLRNQFQSQKQLKFWCVCTTNTGTRLFFREMKWNIYQTHVITTLPRGFHVKTFQIQPSRHTKSSISEPKTAQILVLMYDKHGHKPFRSGNEMKYLPNPRDYNATTWVPLENMSSHLTINFRAKNSSNSGAFVRQTRAPACSFGKWNEIFTQPTWVQRYHVVFDIQ
jgi:hypothetical protein